MTTSGVKTSFNLSEYLESITLKPLVPKNGDDYFKGKSGKCRKTKNKKSVCISPVQVNRVGRYSQQHQHNHTALDHTKGGNEKNAKYGLHRNSPGQEFWVHEKKQNLSPLVCRSQEEVSMENTEEIQYLSLEDFKIYKKRGSRKISPPRDLWKHGDFPDLENLTGKIPSTAKRERILQPNSHSQKNVIQRSAYCQTDEHVVDMNSSTPDALLCRKLPHDIRGTVMNLISQNMENQSVISLLSSLLYKLMMGVLHETSPMGMLSASDLESIENLLSSEMNSLTYFSSRATRGQTRLQSINSCLNNLFMRFPSLHVIPGFSELIPHH